MPETLYFAYGSNIDLEQMARRCPAAQVVGPVTLKNYELAFRGSGVATIVPKKGGVVHGLLWSIAPLCEQALGRYEGYPRHYTKEPVTVRRANGREASVMVYVMAEEWSRHPALPSETYYGIIRRGFKENHLPVSSLEGARDRTIRALREERKAVKAVGRSLQKKER